MSTALIKSKNKNMSFYPSYKKQFSSLSSREKEILRKIPYLKEIDGWLLLKESTQLFKIASNLRDRPIVCEIGVWKGKSSYVLSSAIKNKDGKLYSIDPFNGAGDRISKIIYKKEMGLLDKSLRGNFQDMIKKYELSDIIEMIPKTSDNALKFFKEKTIDLLFIDGNHDYDSVKRDYINWSKFIPVGGKIVIHDVLAHHVDGPRRVFDEIISTKIWGKSRIIGEMGVATRLK